MTPGRRLSSRGVTSRRKGGANKPRNRASHFLAGRRHLVGIMVAMIAAGTSVLIPATAPAATAAIPSTGSHLLVPAALVSRSAAPALPFSALQPATALPWSQVNEITGSGGGGFGSGVAISGSTMVVGAPYTNSAYVYSGSGTTWTEEATLTPSDGVANDYFGFSVALIGSEIVVGAPCHSASANSCTGAAYVFTGSGATWTQTAEMNDPGQATYDFFGLPVTIASGSIVVGAAGENSSAGSLYVYGLHGKEKAVIPDPANTANDLFGTSLASSGTQLVVGAPGTTGSKGAVYDFNEVNGGWKEKATLTASNGEGCSSTCAEPVGLIYGDYFGDSVALGNGVIAVGAPYASYPTPAPDSVGAGAAYVFTGSGRTWSQSSELSDPTEDAANASSPAGCNGFSNPCNALDEFGFDVALVGTTVVASAPYDSQGYPNNAVGAAFVLREKGGTWPSSNPVKVVSSDGVAGDEFGSNGIVAIGTTAFSIAAPYSSGGAYTGSVYFFEH
jgi:hypothetical protein